MGIESDLFFCTGVKIDFVSVCGPKLLVFSASMEIDLVLSGWLKLG